MAILLTPTRIKGSHYLLILAFVTTFHDTVSFCFNSVLEMTGTSVRDVIYERLESANDVQLAAAAIYAHPSYGRHDSDYLEYPNALALSVKCQAS